jgi:A/G-specific adenine glycosylase
VTSADRNAALLAWYRTHRRDLPWRGATGPWAVLVGEVMLQQTQVARVAERYPRFLSRYPTPAALTAVPLATALADWDGLGYPRRLVWLRDTARMVAEHGWPESVEGLARLPGIGPYTAAAVACFAFGVPVPAVDTNHRRVLSRWAGRALSGRELQTTAAALLDADHAADWNQAVMDLGAGVCRPAPACSRCPVEAWCRDPEVRVSVRRQSRFAGSHREARGAVLRALGAGACDAGDLAARTGMPAERVETAVRSLLEDGLVEADGARFALAG